MQFRRLMALRRFLHQRDNPRHWAELLPDAGCHPFLNCFARLPCQANLRSSTSNPSLANQLYLNHGFLLRMASAKAVMPLPDSNGTRRAKVLTNLLKYQATICCTFGSTMSLPWKHHAYCGFYANTLLIIMEHQNLHQVTN